LASLSRRDRIRTRTISRAGHRSLGAVMRSTTRAGAHFSVRGGVFFSFGLFVEYCNSFILFLLLFPQTFSLLALPCPALSFF
jgi:hypothetical protein